MEILSESYFVINSDFELLEYSSLDKACSAQRELVITRQCYSEVRNEQKKFYYKFLFVDKISNEPTLKMTVGNWSGQIRTLWDSDRSNDFKAHFVFTDPSGLIKEKATEGRGFKGITSALKTLINLNKFKSWDEYELREENGKLKTENEKLSQENEALKAQLLELRNNLVDQ